MPWDVSSVRRQRGRYWRFACTLLLWCIRSLFPSRMSGSVAPSAAGVASPAVARTKRRGRRRIWWWKRRRRTISRLKMTARTMAVMVKGTIWPRPRRLVRPPELPVPTGVPMPRVPPSRALRRVPPWPALPLPPPEEEMTTTARMMSCRRRYQPKPPLNRRAAPPPLPATFIRLSRMPSTPAYPARARRQRETQWGRVYPPLNPRM
mmetsp:Transcript_29744/g.60389  ORF Transcript_29744/g.60389 Transcript_29744/m.60389 type:complete len:206 (-) Transcript_29744:1980-2597(-)